MRFLQVNHPPVVHCSQGIAYTITLAMETMLVRPQIQLIRLWVISLSSSKSNVAMGNALYMEVYNGIYRKII